MTDYTTRRYVTDDATLAVATSEDGRQVVLIIHPTDNPDEEELVIEMGVMVAQTLIRALTEALAELEDKP